MTVLDPLFLTVTAGLILTGLVMVGAAVRAYRQTGRRVMVYLSLGFGFIVMAAVSTALGLLFMNIQDSRTLLLMNNGFSMFGYLFVVYSVFSYQ